jgi:hypothetical protein
MRLAPVIRWSARAAAGLLLAALVVVPAEAGGGNANSAVMPVNSKPYGLTYGQWSALHWRWLYSMPADEHPLADTAPAETNQSGKVWFLGGTFTTTDVQGVVTGVADRTITIPTGTSLFFPILDVESSDIEGNGDTGAELAAASGALADLIDPDNLFLEIDGKPVTNLDKYRVVSPVFPLGPLPEDNLLGAPEGTTGISVSDGYFVMLHPLSAGKHTLHFGGFVDLTSVGGPLFALDITYTVTVKKK